MAKNRELSTPDSRVRAYQIALLGADCVLWSEETSVRLRLKHDRMAAQLTAVINRLSGDLDRLEAGDTRMPIVPRRDDESAADHVAREAYEHQEWIANEVQRLSQAIAASVATLERLTAIWLKITAGGAGAMVATMTKSLLLGREMAGATRDVTPRRRMAAGAIHVVDEDQSGDGSDDTD